jgi:hypothetical protein
MERSRLALSENQSTVQFDTTYRRHNRIILIAEMQSLAPKEYANLDPSIWGGGNGSFTWGRVQRFFSSLPETLARHHLMPMHYYMEFISTSTYDDYVEYVGCPLTNRSWWLQQAVALGVLPIDYADAILIVLQENYSRETVEQRLWTLLADMLVTPLLRTLPTIPRQTGIRFFENVANRNVVESASWPWRFAPPKYLDVSQFNMAIKYFEKR